MITLADMKLKEGMKTFHFVLTHKGNSCGTLRLEVIGSACSLHLVLEEWSHNVFKEMISDWDDTVLPFIRNTGCRKAIVSYTNGLGDIGKWTKFIRRLGFPKPETVHISTLEV